MSDHSHPTSEAPHRAGAFDVRNFIGALLGIYGVILFITGLFFTDDEEIAKSADVNVNLWAGLALILVSALFLFWARARPVVVPASDELEDDDRPPAH